MPPPGRLPHCHPAAAGADKILARVRTDEQPEPEPVAPLLQRSRRGGAWREEPYTLFRGYVFVDTEAPLPIYYTVRGQDGVMRWLGASPGTPEALSLAEAVNIRWLAGQDLRPSTAREVMPGVLGFVDGPLAQLSDRIVRVDRHDLRGGRFAPARRRGGQKQRDFGCENGRKWRSIPRKTRVCRQHRLIAPFNTFNFV